MDDRRAPMKIRLDASSDLNQQLLRDLGTIRKKFYYGPGCLYVSIPRKMAPDLCAISLGKIFRWMICWEGGEEGNLGGGGRREVETDLIVFASKTLITITITSISSSIPINAFRKRDFFSFWICRNFQFFFLSKLLLLLSSLGFYFNRKMAIDSIFISSSESLEICKVFLIRLAFFLYSIFLTEKKSIKHDEQTRPERVSNFSLSYSPVSKWKKNWHAYGAS